jgi:Domain of unknown function (DUF397)
MLASSGYQEKLEMRSDEPSSGPIKWRASSFCSGGECAEVAMCDGMIVVRNSTDPQAVVQFTAGEWLALTRGIRAGDFDDLT